MTVEQTADSSRSGANEALASWLKSERPRLNARLRRTAARRTPAPEAGTYPATMPIPHRNSPDFFL